MRRSKIPPAVLAIAALLAGGALTRPASAAGGIAGVAAAESGAAAAPVATAPAEAGSRAAVEFDRFVEEFLAQRPDRARCARVESLTLDRDAARITLASGDLWLATPAGGRTCAAVFAGAATFSFTPPGEFEQRELLRFYHTTSLEVPLRSVVLIFTDSTGEELSRRAALHDQPESSGLAELLSSCLDTFGDPRGADADPQMLSAFLDPGRSGYLFAFLCGRQGERLMFVIDPSQYEEVALWRVAPARFFPGRGLDRAEGICQFPRGGAYDTTARWAIRPDFTVRGYRVHCVVTPELGFSATAEMEGTVVRDDARWIPFRLHDGLVVDSVSWDGRPAEFRRPRGRSFLWVRRPDGAAANAGALVRAAYHGDLFDSVGGWILLKSTTGWYPRPPGASEATFELSYESPSEYQLRSVGERVSIAARDRVSVSTWRVERPTQNATFVLGRFREQEFGSPDSGRVQALMPRGRNDLVSWRSSRGSITQGGGLRDWVAADAAKSLAFYRRFFGPAQTRDLAVAQVPALQGEAFPGLVNIPETAFGGPTAVAEDQVFRAHEVAHQWWGYAVVPRTYHDHWLMEGFANYSGLWYLQSGLGRRRDYFDLLAKWRSDLLDDRRTRPEHGRQAGPIWLGPRNATNDRPSDYVLIDYKKGAWVLHMLRSLLLDLDAMDDSRFAAILGDFFRENRGGAVSTEDFRRIAERHAGQDLGWFFDQWVYRNDLPTYAYATSTERTPEGSYRVHCRVHQSGVPGGFRMPVTLRVEFGPDRFAWVRRVIEGPTSRFDLPLMPAKPTRIVFNDLESVLCDVKETSW